MLQKNVPNWKRVEPLNFKECRNNALLSLAPTRPTLRNVLSVIGCNDVLASLGVVHDGFSVREEAIKGPVEDAGGDEGVDIADVETASIQSVALLVPN